MKQQKNGWCGPATLQYALNKLGTKVGQETLAKKVNTDKRGTDSKDMRKALAKMGFKTKVHQGKNPNVTLKKLHKAAQSKNKAVVVDYLTGKDLNNDGHYSALVMANGRRVAIWDPSPGRTRTIPKKKFISNWKDTTKKGRKISTWGMEIAKA
jgi:ABC-type bacteriocin/lantibiotic exporter with double-glycine peptidase domain